MRSPQKALRDGELLLRELKLTREDLVAVSVYSTGELFIQLRPEAFGRVFVALRIPKGKLRSGTGESQHGEYVHASFRARAADWSTTIRAPQWHAMLKQWMAQLPDSTRRLVQASPALCLTGPDLESEL